MNLRHLSSPTARSVLSATESVLFSNVPFLGKVGIGQNKNHPKVRKKFPPLNRLWRAIREEGQNYSALISRRFQQDQNREQTLASKSDAVKLESLIKNSYLFAPNLKLHILPRYEMNWEDFCAHTPRHSIALDGFVYDPPHYDAKTKHINFDHHKGVVREATMSTAMQVYYALQKGLFPHFAKKSQETHIYINDCDQDTALALWLLKNHESLKDSEKLKRIEALVYHVNKQDVTGGTFPVDSNSDLVRQIRWIFEPYNQLRKSDQFADSDSAILYDVLEKVFQRMDLFVAGQARESSLDDRYDILFHSAQFMVVNEIGGIDARTALLSRFPEIPLLVSLVSEREDGRLVYTILKNSIYADISMEDLYQKLNQLEEKKENPNAWGGSDLIGGCRNRGSKLIPQEINKFLMTYFS